MTTKTQVKCPMGCDVTMRPKPSGQVAELLGAGGMLKMLGGGMDRSRGKWVQCPSCKLVLMFEKGPGEA